MRINFGFRLGISIEEKAAARCGGCNVVLTLNLNRLLAGLASSFVFLKV